ncbi:23S rRNA (uracil(747)-C(5))-methyltransferase RlmC [Demequina sp.]|uniref:23S rRNA (uracil(747)-C(5))-methyltransferase RlmC n=1 Tax=Demequina sp. TaxID=2050685 RepID=UPI003D13BD98
MECAYYQAGRCRSCTIIELTHPQQVARKVAHCTSLLPSGITWLEPVVGPERGFRTKAKMVVGGSVDSPTLGILSPDGTGVDLAECPLYPGSLSVAFAPLSEFVTRARLEPYSVAERRGELKNMIITAAPSGELMVRFVLRSTESLARIRKHLPWLQERLPQLAVASVNLLPEHRAVVEGETEILLTDASSLTMAVNGIDLHLQPQSFFQTNTDVATALYRQAREWVQAVAPASVWDLYCGVGGFALHVTAPGRTVTGVEVAEAAVESARLSAAALGVDAEFIAPEFIAADATQWALAQAAAPELVIVNPPRRGIGEALADWLEASGVPTVVYSSCNSESLARDLARMPSLRPTRGRVLDMFPHTEHYEVAVLLHRM